MKLSKILLISISIISIASLSGCAGNPISTPYQPDKGSFRGGYEDVQLSENMFQVSFKGNAYVDRSTTSDFALLRSAELCLENNFNYFAIVDSDTHIKENTIESQGSLTTYKPLYGGPTSVNYEEGRALTFSKPTSKNTIICYNNKGAHQNLYNAKIVVKSMTSAHNIDFKKHKKNDVLDKYPQKYRNEIQNLMDKRQVPPEFFEFLLQQAEIEDKFKLGLINLPEYKSKTNNLTNKMNKSKTIQEWHRKMKGNTSIVNYDRFYKLSQCKNDKNIYKCIDGKESYEGSGVASGSLFLPSEYETYKVDNCNLLTNKKYKCALDDGSTYEGNGLINGELFLPVY